MQRDKNETVTVEIVPASRLRVSGQIADAMEKKGIVAYDYEKLGLGIELPAGWPADRDAQPTLAELVVFAAKLDMKIIIGDLNMVPRKKKSEENQTRLGARK